MKPYGIKSPVKLPCKTQWNIKIDGKKQLSWWESIVAPNKSKQRKLNKVPLQDYLERYYKN